MLFAGSPNSNKLPQNRYTIAAANGPMLLSVPVKGGRRNSVPLNELAIDYTHAWQRRHWRTLFSAYGKAPFFEHFCPELEALLFAGYERLLDFNLASIEWLKKSMRLDLHLTATAQSASESTGLIASFSKFRILPYNQVFDQRWGFLPDMSAIDLLMNEGPYAASYLQQQAVE